LSQKLESFNDTATELKPWWCYTVTHIFRIWCQ